MNTGANGRSEPSRNGTHARKGPSKLVPIGTFGTLQEAHLARACLEQFGIWVELADEFTGTQPYLSGANAGIKLFVTQSDAQRAIQILREARPNNSYSAPNPEIEGKLIGVVLVGVVAGVFWGLVVGDANSGVVMSFFAMMFPLLIWPLVCSIWRDGFGKGE